LTDKAEQKVRTPGPPAARPAIWIWGILAVVVAAGVFLRLYDLSADPPLGMTWSHALYTDGARIVEGARTRVLWGNWEMDPGNTATLYYPLSSLLAYGVFGVFGVGLWQANLTGAIPGILMLLLLFRVGSRKDVWVGVGACLLAGLSFYAVTYNRLPMSESLMVALMLVVPLLLLRDPLSWWEALLAGLALSAAAFFVKLHALVLLPVAIVWLALFRGRGESEARNRGRPLGMFCAGVGLGLVVWLLVFLVPRPGAMADFLQHNLIAQYGKGQVPQGIAGFLGDRVLALVGLGTNVSFFGRMPLVALAAFLTALGFTMNWRSRRSAEHRVESFFALWLLGAVVALSLLDYRPLRYHLQIIPPMVVLCSLGLVRFVRAEVSRPCEKQRAAVLWIFVFATFIAFQILMEVPVYMGRHGAGSQSFLSALGIDPGKAFGGLSRFVGSPSTVLFVAVLAAAASAVLYVRVVRVRRNRALSLRERPLSPREGARSTIPFSFRVAGVGVLVGLCVLIDVTLHRTARAGIRHSLRDVSVELGRILGDGAFVVGTTATTLTLNNPLQSLPAYGHVMRQAGVDRFRQYPITHVLLRDGPLSEFLRSHFPETLDRLVFMRRFVMGPAESGLYRVEGWPAGADYRPTAYERGMGELGAGELSQAVSELRAFLDEHPDDPSGLF